MRVLQVHNKYLTGKGGEDTVVEEESNLLRSYGHEVEQFFVETSAKNTGSVTDLAKTAIGTVWSGSSARDVSAAIERFEPDVVHVHNTFPLLSPSIFWAIKRSGVRCVYTLHNYRLMCAGAFLMRDNLPCELCVEGKSFNAVKHRCYRGSVAGSASLALSQSFHSTIGTYAKSVDAFIVLSNFAKDLFVRAGLPTEKLFVKPNFVRLSGQRLVAPQSKKDYIFVGKISYEKGVDRLLEAWRRAGCEAKLRIVGDGPQRDDLQRRSHDLTSVEWLGWLGREEVFRRVAESRFIVLSSIWYEGFPMVLVEAMLQGTPAIVPDLGAMPEIIDNGRAGVIYANNGDALTDAFANSIAMPDRTFEELSRQALEKARESFSSETNYKALLSIYEKR